MTTLVCLFTVFFLTASQFQSSVGQICDVDAHCGPGECCRLILYQASKREENTTLPVEEINGTALDLASPRGNGLCQPFSQEGEICSCGCAQGLRCISSDFTRRGTLDPGIVPVPAPVCRKPCTSDGDCCNDDCCEIQPSFLGLFQPGWCRPLAQEGEECTSFGCRRCAPGLECLLSYVPWDGDRLTVVPPRVCTRPCNFDGECGKRQCCYISSLLKKRFAPYPTWGTCQDFSGLGEPCSGPCGCDPELICSSKISTWWLDSIINSTFIPSLPEICIEPVFTIS